ncbi:hypothetical protein L083_1391 [Actinoplanes sp. N902-109]|nr:hypothetical protein L083_1391 [Actinoplanes sp. N902-109]
MSFADGVLLQAGRNLTMHLMNPSGYLAVLGGDERRSTGRDARRCDG